MSPVVRFKSSQDEKDERDGLYKASTIRQAVAGYKHNFLATLNYCGAEDVKQNR